jgi:ATP-dependent Lhr-like helicase
MIAEDLLAAAFPDAAACLENIPGDRQIPDHPLVKQTVHDCLTEAMDIDGLVAVLERIHAGRIRLVARDTPEPSVFAHEILNARPYAFLDDAPLEERRAHAVQTRRAGEPSAAGDLGALDLAAIDRVRDEARPDPRDADEAHDALVTAGFLFESEVPAPGLLQGLAAARRASRFGFGTDAFAPSAGARWIAAERLPELMAVHPAVHLETPIAPPPSRAGRAWGRAEALTEIVRARLTVLGPATAADLAASLGVDERAVDDALLALEGEGVILRGHFTAPAPGAAHAETAREAETAESEADRQPGAAAARPLEWCDRTLLARIHRYTLNRLRAEIEPVSAADYMRFLFAWQHVEPSAKLTGVDGLREAIAGLDGFELGAAAWERAVLPARLDRYDPAMLDMLCLAGEVGWARLSTPRAAGEPPRLAPATPIALFLREHADAWRALRARAVQDPAPTDAWSPEHLAEDAQRVLSFLQSRGASFFDGIRTACGLDRDAARQAIGALVAAGLAASDGFSGLRALVWAAQGRHESADRRAKFAGRWTAVEHAARTAEEAIEIQAWTLLRRYGVVFRRVLAREALAAPWRELVRVYRRLEARGEVRGGRFVSGMSGEQFALPAAIPLMREIRRRPADGGLVAISTADPLNLVGIVTSGDRVRAAGRNRLVYRDGVAIALREGDTIRELTPLDAHAAAEVRTLLTRRHGTTSAAIPVHARA